ncbi:MAG: carbohydrate ABC transporter permease [Firmicutes bacterium]|nr:carbohydrate ABC transporter permease [Bacillota bacterium]
MYRTRRSSQDIIIDICIYLFIILFSISIIYPFLYVLSLSFSAPSVPFTEINIIPPEVSIINYQRVFKDKFIASGFRNSVIRLVTGCFFSMSVTILLAYPLSKKYLPNRTFWMALIVFTMYFSGGLIPNYLLVKNLGLINKVWALVLPRLVTTYHMIIVRNFFASIPETLEESARIDGAKDFRILFSIILPLSMPIIATLFLWTAVYHWNAWFDALMYITDPKKQVLQNVTRRIVIEAAFQEIDVEYMNPESFKAAATIITIMPILLVYPFIQKYFVKGIMVGSLKG